MASLPIQDAAVEGLFAEKADEIILVQVNQIDAGSRLRSIDPAWADALGLIMLRDGQQTPIEVCRLPGQSRWTLVAGGHRHAAAELHGIEYLRAIVVTADKAKRELREIAENLWRRELDPVDRAAFIARLVAIKRAGAGLAEVVRRDGNVNKGKLAPGHDVQVGSRAIAAEANEAEDTISTVYGWTDEVAADLGLSSRTLRRDLLVYRGVSQTIINRLRDARHALATNATQLRALAKLDPAAQGQIVDRLLAGEAKSVSDAFARSKGSNRAADPGAKRLSAFIGSFQRMALAERKAALAELSDLLPAGFRLVRDGGAA